MKQPTINIVYERPVVRGPSATCSKCGGAMWCEGGIHGHRLTERGPVDCLDQPIPQEPKP